jgi:hypothetical protein
MAGVEAVENVPAREFCAMPAKCDLIERARIHAKLFGGVNAYAKVKKRDSSLHFVMPEMTADFCSTASP